MAYRIVLRRDTSTNWTTNNPVLLLGEPGYETDTSRMKIGDGSTLWADLPYYVGYDLLALDSDLIPATGGTYDLGATAGYSWRDLYLSGNTIYLGDATLSAVGSSVSMDTIILGGPTADGGVIVSATGGYLTSDGNVIVGPTGPTGGFESQDRLISSNPYETLEVILDSQGTLNTPLLLPTSFTAICDEEHMIDPVVFEGSDWWEFEVEFQVSSYGTVAVMINNIFPIPTNPGYDSGYTFRFTEADHGIPNYNFDIQLNDVVQAGPAGWTSNLEVSQGPEYPSTIESLGAIKITSNSNSIILGTDGVLYIPNGIEFPLSNGNNRTGEGNNLQFEKGSAFQKIISTQDGTELVPTVERLVISGGDSYFDGSEYSGEGGDIYLWAGQGQNGGDIKVDAGDGTDSGGTVKVRGGYASNSGSGGFVELSAGGSNAGNGGSINITSGQGGSGNGGFIGIQAGYGTNQGGSIGIQAGNGGSAGGNISLIGSAGAWTFKQNGALAFPDGSEQTTAFLGNTIDSTYDDLVGAINGSQLIPGFYYIITDFRTCYDVPEYYVNGNTKDNSQIDYREGPIEPIIVLATGENTISSSAYQSEHPNDRIQYDWTWASTERTGGNAYGRIFERIDEYNNRTDYDHRNIYFNRFQSYYKNTKLTGVLDSYNSGTGIVTGNGTLYTEEVSQNNVLLFEYQDNLIGFKVVTVDSDTQLTVVVDSSFGNQINFTGGLIELFSSDPTGYFNEYKEVYVGQKNQEDWDDVTTFNLNGGSLHNYIGDYSKFYLQEVGTTSGFLLANNVFNGNNIYSNTIGDRSYNNTGRYWFVRNTISGRFYSNVIGQNGFYSNDIGEYFNNNVVRSSMYVNIISEGFENNLIDSSFYNNRIGNYFDSNKIYGEFNGNTTDRQFSSNSSYSNFTNNQISNQFINNQIYSEFSANEIGNYFASNTIGDSGNKENFDFLRNKIGTDFYSNTIRQNFQNNQIGNGFSDNIANGDFYENIIGNEFSGNGNIGFSFYGNRIGNSFISNPLIGDYFSDNQIGEYFGSDGGFFLGNSISYYFNNNQIGNKFRANTLGNTQYFNWDNTSIENLTERTYDTFYTSLNGLDFENVILGKELIMHDIFNDEYHKVKFTQWTQNNNGGGFSYERTKVYPSVEPTVYFTKTNYGSEIDVIVEGSLEITRGNNGGIYNYADEGGWDQNVSPSGTLWNSIYTQPENGNSFSDNKIGNQFKGNYILNEFSLNDVKSYIGANQFLGYTRGNSIGDFTSDNDFLGDSVGNTWKGDFVNNIMGNSFSANSFYEEIYNNNIGDNFIGNSIQSFFNDNIIGDNFGFGTSQIQGNKIGNNFSNNIIGEYFYNNSIPDNFSYNTVGNNFEWNTIDTRIESIDFTANYGNITGFYYIAGGTSAADNTYIGLTGSVSGGATGGIGSGASFDVIVAGGTVSSVTLNTAGSQYTTNDTITILGTAIGGITGGIQTFTSNAIGKTGADDTYIGLVAGGTAGGENSSFTVTVTSSLVSDIQIYDKGVAYSIGDNLTILGSQFGGTDGSDDISITVDSLYSDSIVIGITGISQTPSVYEEYTCQIFERQGGNKRLSFYDENDVLTIKNINE